MIEKEGGGRKKKFQDFSKRRTTKKKKKKQKKKKQGEEIQRTKVQKHSKKTLFVETDNSKKQIDIKIYFFKRQENRDERFQDS